MAPFGGHVCRNWILPSRPSFSQSFWLWKCSSPMECFAANSKVFNTDLIFALELGFMIDCAEAIALSSLERKESRGAQFRLDYPSRDDENWLKHTLMYRDEEAEHDVRVETSDVTITQWEPVKRVY